jgi:hypothetical protein
VRYDSDRGEQELVSMIPAVLPSAFVTYIGISSGGRCDKMAYPRSVNYPAKSIPTYIMKTDGNAGDT